jgi:ATP-dependent DNA ligase
MLAQLQSQLPIGDGWRYEPKLDGFRGMLQRHSRTMQLLSRNGRDLGPWFPELIQAGQALPADTLIDGEIVIADQRGQVDFGALQARLTIARKDVSRRALEQPAVLVAFDVLEARGTSLVNQPLSTRRTWLERLVREHAHPCLQLMEQTSSGDIAREWRTLLPTIEGVVAKRADSRYDPGRRRDWVKVKRYRTADCAVIGVAGDVRSPKLVLGLRHVDGKLHHLGVTRELRSDQTTPIQHLFERLGPQEGAIPSRWQHDAVPPWRPVPIEVVCEVRIGLIDNGRWLRQPATFLRWRPDRSPHDCYLEQLS